MADWHMEGPWIKNCNCDPGCPCDFNQAPTHDHCEGSAGMKIEKGHFGDVDLSGLHWIGLVRWPGRMDEGNGSIQAVIDERADDRQREALGTILTGQAGGTFFEILAAVCPNGLEPVFAPFEAFDVDLENRTSRVVATGAFETESETLRAIGSEDPYRVLVRIPGGFEYTGPNSEAETALAKFIRAPGFDMDLADSHSSLAWVEYSGQVPAAA